MSADTENKWELPNLLSLDNVKADSLHIIYSNVAEIKTKEGTLKDGHWSDVRRMLIEGEYTGMDLKKEVLKKCGDRERNTIMLACTLDPPLDVVKLLVQGGGGKDAIMDHTCDQNYNAIHYACWTNASPEVIQYLVKTGGKESLVKKNERGNTPLHTLCHKYDLDSLPSLIKHMIRVGKHEMISAANKNNEIPLQCLVLRPGLLHVDAITTYLDEWYKLEQTKAIILSCTYEKVEGEDGSEGTDVIKVTSRSFTHALRQIEHNSEKCQMAIMRTEFMKTYLTQKFIQPLPLAVIMMDLYIQAMIVFVLFFFNNTSSHLIKDETVTVILSICIIWRVSREIMQVMTTTLGDYISDISNWMDIIQTFLICSVINRGLYGQAFLSTGDRNVLGIITFIAWFELIFEVHHFVYELAIFVVASIKVLRHLIPFICTTLIFVLMFSHMYHITGPDDSNLCNNTNDYTEEEFANGGWTCELSDSIEKSFSIFFNFDIPSGVPLAITYLYAFVMEIFLLNVLIAVICTAFDNVQDQSEMRFWLDRQDIVEEIQNIANLFPTRITKWFQQGFKEEDVRYNFNFFMEDSVWHHLNEDNNKDCELKKFIQWWYAKDTEIACPPIMSRLSFFIRKSNWKDILLPGMIFENILLGHHRSHVPEAYWKLITFPCSIILMVTINVLMIVVFILGLISFGLLWPRAMKLQLFSVRKNDD